MPRPLNPPLGCVFNTRCPVAMDRCFVEIPLPNPFGDGREIACHAVFPDATGILSSELSGQTAGRSGQSSGGRSAFSSVSGAPAEQETDDSFKGRIKANLTRRVMLAIAAAIVVVVWAAMYLGGFGLGAEKEFATVPADVIESRMDDYFAREGCIRGDAVVQLDLKNSDYARILYLQDNPGKPGSYLPPRTVYQYHYAEGSIVAVPERTTSLCY